MINLGIRPVPVRLDARLVVQRKLLKNIEINARVMLSPNAVISRKNGEASQ